MSWLVALEAETTSDMLTPFLNGHPIHQHSVWIRNRMCWIRRTTHVRSFVNTSALLSVVESNGCIVPSDRIGWNSFHDINLINNRFLESMFKVSNNGNVVGQPCALHKIFEIVDIGFGASGHLEVG